MKASNLLRSARRLHDSSPTGFAISLLAALFLLVALYARHAALRDPGSLFFDPERAYAKIYSAVRMQQALDYVAAADPEAGATVRHKSASAGAPKICVGIPSVAREGARYLRSAVGSVLEGLTQKERDAIHLIVFLPHTTPEIHPAWGEAWLKELPDELLLYDSSLDEKELGLIQGLEADPEGWRTKELYDYEFVLKKCYHNTSAPFIAIIEDDTLALDGWFHRTMEGLGKAETKTAARRGGKDDFLYLRLFYTEEFLGFNSEDWMAHTFWSLLVIVSFFAFGVLSLVYIPRTRLVTPLTVAIAGVVFVPMFIVLFFVTGKVTTMPLPHGVNEMSNYGCCSQGLVFPREKVPSLIQWYDRKGIGFVDSEMEDFANQNGELRWALTPPVVQHIGRKSSKGDSFAAGAKSGMSVASRLWNFAFETNNADKLRQEHAQVAALSGG